MLQLSEVQKLNRELAERINQEALANPQSPYANKFVGIANGQVVLVADNEELVLEQLERLQPDAQRTFYLEPGEDPNEVTEIWSAE